MNMAKRNEGKIVLKINMLDESGVGVCDDIEVGIIEHGCQFDQDLASYDWQYGEIIKDEMVHKLLSTGEIAHLPCSICKLQGSHARKQFHAEAKDDAKVKRRPSNYTDLEAIDIKRLKGKFISS